MFQIFVQFFIIQTSSQIKGSVNNQVVPVTEILICKAVEKISWNYNTSSYYSFMKMQVCSILISPNVNKFWTEALLSCRRYLSTKKNLIKKKIYYEEVLITLCSFIYIENSPRGLFRTLSNIYDGAFSNTI